MIFKNYILVKLYSKIFSNIANVVNCKTKLDPFFNLESNLVLQTQEFNSTL